MRIKAFIACLCLAALLCSCSFNLGIEGLMLPPRLTDEQNEIYAALQKVTDSNIKLKYPRTGEYRSAFVLVNLDDDIEDEAVVFYEETLPGAKDSSLRINILDKEDDKWKSVYKIEGTGTDIDKAIFSTLGNGDEIYMIIGFSTLGQTEKVVKVYRYSDLISGPVYEGTYSIMEVLDIDNSGTSKIVLITGNTVSQTATAKLLQKTDKGIEVTHEVGMDTKSIDYTNVTRGNLSEDRLGLFIDSDRGTNLATTEVLIYDDRLKNIVYNKFVDNTEMFLRVTGNISTDIDKDGIVEIPSTSLFPGYEKEDKNKQVHATTWYAWDTKEKKFVKKHYSYYNFNDGYVFMLPQRWSGKVTVKRASESNELVFYKFDGEMTDDMIELMRIKVSNRTEDNRGKNLGYRAITAFGQNEYLVKITDNEDEPLVPTMSEITHSFILLNQE